MWSRHLQWCFNSWPSSCTREIRLKSAPQICFVPSTLFPAPVLFSSPTLLLFNKHLGRTIYTWCIDPHPVVEERGRGVGDGKGFRIDWEENEKLGRQGFPFSPGNPSPFICYFAVFKYAPFLSSSQ